MHRKGFLNLSLPFPCARIDSLFFLYILTILEIFTAQNQDMPVDVSLSLFVAELVMSKN